MDEAAKSNQNSTTWSETYRHAIIQASEAEREKYQADLDQQNAERIYFDIEKTVEKLQKDFRRSINKAKPYYDMKVGYHKELEFHKRKISGLENCVNEAKTQYQQSLRNLERISNEIHEQRKQGKLRKDLKKRISNVNEELLTPIETKSSQTISENNSIIKNQTNNSDELLHSRLLRTENLPAGIFINPNNHYINEDDNITKLSNDFNNQFILCSKQAPPPLINTHSEKDSNNLTIDNRERCLSFSSQVTDDDDDKSGSIHILSDDQLDHLSSVYHPFSSELSSQTGMHEKSLKQSNSIISQSLLY